ncbi:MAG: TetR/AcrR family transcriptional regulator [Deltaproteobacteria bacterium]|nr:MAG: TetR/AcrR family transcriptional regulator [Deltaproteobacteria bacterium]
MSKLAFAASPRPLEPTAERRREQLIRAAAFVIETEGTDAMRIPRVAEVAGCARSLVYRYFPSREDLFVAVIAEFYENLGRRLSPNATAAGMRSLTDRDAARPLLEAIWESITEVGAAGLILYASPRLGVELADRFAEVSAQQETLWLAPLRERGLTEIEAALVSRSAAAMLTEFIVSSRSDEVTRDAALDLGQRALAGMIEGLLRERRSE